MKEFDIGLAKAHHPVKTKSGKPVRIICYDRIGCSSDEPHIVALVSDIINCKETFERIVIYTQRGRKIVLGHEQSKSEWNLCMAEEEVHTEVYVNLYVHKSTGEVITGRNTHISEMAAKMSQFLDMEDGYVWLATKKIEL